MQEFFLVIDTETSGLPKNWQAPYSAENNWPYIIQIAWIVYDQHHQEVKRENHFIYDPSIAIAPSATDIHHITKEFLAANGEDKSAVLKLLLQDLKVFKPLIIGHFIEFDLQMLHVELHRTGQFNPLNSLSYFCTMKASEPFVRNPKMEQLKLNEFYIELFNEVPKQIHNALSDAIHTAKIFFHLMKINLVEQAEKSDSEILKTNTSKPSVKSLSSRSTLLRLLSIFFYG